MPISYAPPPRPRKPSRLRPFLHGFLAALAVGVVGAVLGGMGVFPNPDKAAEWTGGAAFWLFVAVAAASFASRAGVRWLGVGLVTLAAAICLGIVAFWANGALHTREPEHPIELTAHEEYLATSDHDRVCNDLGFSLPMPESFSHYPDIQTPWNEQLAAQKAHDWAYAREDEPNERIFVVVSKGLGGSEESLAGFSRGLARSADKQSMFTKNAEHLTWSDDQGEYVLSLTSTNAFAIDFRCLGRAAVGNQPPLIVCVETVARRPDILKPVRAGLSLNGC